MIKKILPFIIIFLLIVVIKGRIDALTDLRGSGSTVVDIRNELEKEKGNNLYLTEMLKYVRTNEYVELEARERLNYARENEAIVLNSYAESNISENESIEEDTQVWKKWINIFF